VFHGQAGGRCVRADTADPLTAPPAQSVLDVTASPPCGLAVRARPDQVAALLRDYDIRPVVVHPTKRADFSRHGYRAAQFEDAFARFLPHEPNIRTLKSGREEM
jgi:Protein of unknown function (DUF3631)